MASTDPALRPKWPAGDVGMAGIIRTHGWAATSLGPIDHWPQSLRTLVDLTLNSALPCAVICGRDRLLLYNDACANLQGDSHPGSLGQPADRAFPEALSDTGPIHDRLVAGQALVFRNRPWVFRKQGVLTTGYYDAYFTPVQDESGLVAFVHATILPQGATPPAPPMVGAPPSDAHAHGASDVLWILDIGRMQLEYATPALGRLLGTDRDTVMGDFHQWLGLVLPDDAAIAADHLARSASGEAVTARYRIIRPGDGQVVRVRHTSFPIQDGAGHRVAGLVQDVTLLETGMAALQAEKERYRTLAEGIPHLVWRSSDDGLWTWASPQWLEFTGQTQEQSLGWGWLDVIHPDDRDATMQAWHAARPHGMLDVSYRVRSVADGSWRWYQTRSLPRRSAPRPGEPEGPIIEWLGTSTDIDDLKRLQARQAALIADLAHRTESLTAIIQSLASPEAAPPPR